MQHLSKLGLVGGSEHHQVRDAAQVCQVEHPVMGRAVLAHKSGTIEAEDHVQVLQCNIHDELVICALHERRVDGDHGHASSRSKSCGKSYGMLFGDPDIEEAVWIGGCESIETGTRRHRGGDRTDAVVERRLGQKRAAERLGIGKRPGGRAVDLAGLDLKRTDPVEGIGLVLGVGVARPLAGDHVDDDRSADMLRTLDR